MEIDTLRSSNRRWNPVDDCRIAPYNCRIAGRLVLTIAARCRSYSPSFVSPTLPFPPLPILPFFHPFVLALTIAARCRSYSPSFVSPALPFPPLPILPSLRARTNHCLLFLPVVELGEREDEAVYGGNMRRESEDAEYDDENGAVVSPGEVL